MLQKGVEMINEGTGPVTRVYVKCTENCIWAIRTHHYLRYYLCTVSTLLPWLLYSSFMQNKTNEKKIISCVFKCVNKIKMAMCALVVGLYVYDKRTSLRFQYGVIYKNVSLINKSFFFLLIDLILPCKTRR